MRRRKRSKHVRLLERSIQDPSLRGCVACFAKDHDPRGRLRLDDASFCIKGVRQYYFVVSLGECGGKTPRVCRFLHLAEVCKLQGVCPNSIPAGIRVSVLRRALAGAMTVPIVGSAMNSAMLASAGARQVPVQRGAVG